MIAWLLALLLWMGALERTRAEPPSATDPSAERQRALSAEARVHTEHGRYAEARALYEALLAGEPANRELRLALARVNAWDERFAAAAAEYEALLKERPHDVEALAGLIDVFVWTGRLQEAQAETARGLAFAPAAPELWLRSARFAYWSGDRDRAIEHAERAERLSPRDPDIRTFRDGLFRSQLRFGALTSRFPPGYPALYVGSLQALHFVGRLQLEAEAQLFARIGGPLERGLFDGLYTAGLSYRSKPRIAPGLALGFGAPDHTVPRLQLKPSLFYQLTPRWSAALAYAYWFYRDEKSAHLMNASVGCAITERLLLDVRTMSSYVVLGVSNDREQRRARDVVMGGGVRLSWRVRPAFGVAGGYTYGPQLEQASRVALLGSASLIGLTSHVVNVSADWLLRRHVGVQPGLTFERRTSDDARAISIFSAELASYVRW